MKKNFSDRLKEALDYKNMKQAELAAKLNINTGLMCRYVSGERKPKYERIKEIADALDINEDWLLGHDVPIDKPELITEDQFIELINQWLSNPDIPKDKKEEFLQKSIDDLNAQII